MAKIIIKCRCEVCQKEIVSDDYVDSYKEVRPVEMLYRNGGMIDVRFYLECETNGKENNGKENNICIMDIPELCSECQQKIGKALRDACDKVLHELLPCDLVEKFKRDQEQNG